MAKHKTPALCVFEDGDVCYDVPKLEIKAPTYPLKDLPVLRSSEQSSRYLRAVFEAYPNSHIQEHFFVVALSQKNAALGAYLVGVGSVNGTVASPTTVFSVLLATPRVAGFILCHNHPSGACRPSETDINLTRKIKEGAKVLDLNIIDHVILDLGSESYFSFADEGML